MRIRIGSLLFLALASCAGSEDSTGRTLSAASCPPVSTMFANAVCVCEDLAHVGGLRVGDGPSGSGSVGVNGRTSLVTAAEVSGSWSSGGDIDAVGAIVGGSIVTPGSVTLTGTATVKGDATIGGDLTCTGSLAIDGSLGLGGDESVLGTSTIGARTAYVAPTALPCDCDPATFFDVDAAVADARAAAGGTSSFTLGVGNTELRLASGNYYVTAQDMVGNAAIAIEGDVAIFVDGSLALVGNSAFQVADGARLDLFVSGDVGAVGNVFAGNANDPSAFRLYIGGAGTTDIGIVGNTELAGTLYAPRATLNYVGNVRVTGAVFAKTFTSVGNVEVLYGADAVPPPSCPEGDGDGPDGPDGPGGEPPVIL